MGPNSKIPARFTLPNKSELLGQPSLYSYEVMFFWIHTTAFPFRIRENKGRHLHRGWLTSPESQGYYICNTPSVRRGGDVGPARGTKRKVVASPRPRPHLQPQSAPLGENDADASICRHAAVRASARFSAGQPSLRGKEQSKTPTAVCTAVESTE